MPNLFEIIKGSEEKKKNLYSYYLKLGYNEKVSFVLSVFTYGHFYPNRTVLNTERDTLSYFIARYKKIESKIPFIYYVYDELEKFYVENQDIKNVRDLIDGFNSIHSEKVPESPIMEFSVKGPSFLGNVFRSSASKRANMKSVECGLGPMAVNSVAREMCTREKCTMDSLSDSADMGMFCEEAELIDENFIENFATDSYENIEEKGFVDTLTNPTSTFRMTNNTASVGILLNNLRNGRNVDKNQVRIEELMNYFKYDLSVPSKRMFNINTELYRKPNSDNKLLFIGVQGKKEVLEKQNIVVLLDVSGSMTSNNLVTQLSIATLVSKLKIGNIFSLVTYSTSDATYFDGYVINNEEDKVNILSTLLQIEINGCTNGSAGVETAYKIGKEHFIDGGNNHVVLITDGDLNFGITQKDGLEKLIEEKKQTGLFLSVIGTGLYNYKDDKLEVLSKHGNGIYTVVNSVEDVNTSIYENYDSFINAIAKDVKAQVEFNPYFVKRYRLIGYENRVLNHNDFKDDTVISEPFGSGGYGIALYELEMRKEDEDIESELKYQAPTFNNNEEFATVKVRYKEPTSEESKELSVSVKHEKAEFTENLRLIYMIYIISEKMRHSIYITENNASVVEFMMNEYKFDVLQKLNGENLEILKTFYEKC